MLTGISLFSGAVDGLAIAFQAAGIHVTHHMEIDAWCCDVLRHNFPQSIVVQKDVKHVTADDFGTQPIDVVFGSPPCQGFSQAGKRRGFADDRYLWPEMYRLVRELRPRVVLVENVRGSVAGDGDNLADAVLSDLEGIGYAGAAYLVPACLFGAPHERYRVFIVAYAGHSGHTQSKAVANASVDEKRDSATQEQSGRAIADAPQSGGQTLEYTYSSSLETRNSATFRSQAQQLGRRPDSTGRIRSPKSRLGRAADGAAERLDAVANFPGFPAGQGAFQYTYEPARAVTDKTPHYNARIQALGNAVVWQQALPFAVAIARWLKQYE